MLIFKFIWLIVGGVANNGLGQKCDNNSFVTMVYIMIILGWIFFIVGGIVFFCQICYTMTCPQQAEQSYQARARRQRARRGLDVSVTTASTGASRGGRGSSGGYSSANRNNTNAANPFGSGGGSVPQQNARSAPQAYTQPTYAQAQPVQAQPVQAQPVQAEPVYAQPAPAAAPQVVVADSNDTGASKQGGGGGMVSNMIGKAKGLFGGRSNKKR